MSGVCIKTFLVEGSLVSHSPGHCLIGWGPRQQQKDPLATEAPLFFFPDFFLQEPTPWFQHAHQKVIAIGELLALLEDEEKKVPMIRWERMAKKAFFERVEEVQREIEKNRLAKAVPYQFLYGTGEWDSAQRVHALHHLLTVALRYPVHAYGCWKASSGILGGTPELLFTLEQLPSPLLKTMALAGTRDLQRAWHPSKEEKEHRWVIQGIQEALKPFGAKETIGPMEEWPFPTLIHLMTLLTFSFPRPIEFLEAVKALHPTPALGAFPKEAGREWLERMEKEIPRKKYGAPVGFASHFGQQGSCFVAIRNVQWEGSRLQIGAGCGVVAESEKEKEWKEMEQKMHAIQQILGII